MFLQGIREKRAVLGVGNNKYIEKAAGKQGMATARVATTIYE